MKLYYLSALMVFTFGFFTFSSIFLLWWKGISRKSLRMNNPQLVDGVMTVYSAVWFLVNLFLLLVELNFLQQLKFLSGVLGVMSFFYPPLIMQFYFADAKENLPSSVGWKTTIVVVYAVSLTTSLGLLLVLIGWLPLSLVTIFPYSDNSINLINILMTMLFAIAAVYCIILSTRFKPRTLPSSEQSHRRAKLILFVLMIVLFCLALFYITTYLGLLMRSLPLLFIFTTTYYTKRFYFFDIFIKRGVMMLLNLLFLMAFFAFFFPAIEQPSHAWTTPWLYTLAMLPIIMIAPWFYGKLGAWLDKAWFGRKYSLMEANRFFREGLSRVMGEDQLKYQGEKVLSEIFQAPVCIKIRPDNPQALAFQPVISLPFQSHINGAEEGSIHVGSRCSQAPFLSEDLQLLNSLAASFTFLWDNLKAQRQRQVQEQREQELRLHASRSELKALRAQINPHFLFNALNAIAGLIHSDPNRAEETVEQLAEIFRYTLKQSEKEWVRLEEEIDFIRAYLEVEQARFGARLQVKIEADPAVLEFKIPGMMVQTLVENAVKHGISSIRGPGLIHVRATKKEGFMLVEVIDNGLGINSSMSTPLSTVHESTSYGLRNIQERLQGYFGMEARFQLIRDPTNQFTTAALLIPLSRTTDFEGMKP